MTMTFGPGITLGSGITATPTVNGFTLYSTQIGTGQPIWQNTTVIGTNGVDGFENTAAETWLGEGYYAWGLNPNAVANITAAYLAAGLNPTNSTGYVWNVTWGPGSSIASGLAKVGFNANGPYIDIQTIDPTDTRWQEQNNNNGTSLVGTFLFPATFTIYSPLTNKSGWC